MWIKYKNNKYYLLTKSELCGCTTLKLRAKPIGYTKPYDKEAATRNIAAKIRAHTIYGAYYNTTFSVYHTQ